MCSLPPPPSLETHSKLNNGHSTKQTSKTGCVVRHCDGGTYST